MQLLTKIREIIGSSQIMFLFAPLVFAEVLNLFLTPINKFNLSYRLICNLFIMGLCAKLNIQTRNDCWTSTCLLAQCRNYIYGLGIDRHTADTMLPIYNY